MRNLFTLRGRGRRRDFWFQSACLGAAFIGSFLLLESVAGRAATWVLYPPLFWTGFAAAARRYHDLGKTPAWLLLLAIPALGPLWVLLELCLRRGSRGENRYGDDPRGSGPDYFRLTAVRDNVVHDITGLNPVTVGSVVTPDSVEALQKAIRESTGPISVGGGRFSMGGQTASPGSLHLDLSRLNRVLDYSPERRTVRVQAGIRWCDLQRFIDPHGLSVKIMQSYANLSVGGSLSVNCHGRYVGLGPVILSVRSIAVILPDGTRVVASPTGNAELFYGVIGGYGGLGVIAEAELDLVENVRLERVSRTMTREAYPEHFRREIRDSGAVFHNADLYPTDYTRLRSVSWFPTTKPVSDPRRLRPLRRSYPVNRYLLWACSESTAGKWRREFLLEPLYYLRKIVRWRNHEAGYDIGELEPRSRERSTYALQEYFVPEERFAEFVPRMTDILRRHGVNVLNVSVRHSVPDPGSYLAWARGHVFAFVLYVKQGVEDADQVRVGIWTRELIDAALASGGSYYLPYQAHATREQFHRAYPRAGELFALKRRYDPEYRLRNVIWDTYYVPPPAPATEPSEFRRVYGEAGSADRFYAFLRNIFHLYPEQRFHALIRRAARGHSTDEAIYRELQQELPGIKPFLADLTLAIPALRKQKREMTRQTLELLAGRRTIRGYVEIGTTGRYISALRKRVRVDGRIVLIHDAAPTNSPADILERGGVRKLGEFLPLNDYAPIRPEDVPDASVDLVTCYIGLHHAAPERLPDFLRSVARILRPGGLFILRDHDVRTPEMDTFVRLAHGVFNAGLGVSWEENQKERRHFAPVEQWSRLLSEAGLGDRGPRLLQENDPTDNTLLAFGKPGTPAAEPLRKPAGLLTRMTGAVLLSLFLGGVARGDVQTPPEHRRAEDQTFLTFPEWFLVFSPAEYADFIRSRPPSEFPWFGHVGQYWSGYREVDRATRGKYPFNGEYHTMMMVIGASMTAEHSLKSGYETVIGRISEASRRHGMTEEDRFTAAMAKDYVDFIRVSPWYDYDFLGQLKRLWTETSLVGRDLPRKWERKYALTTECLLKAAYGWLLGKATHATYELPRSETAVLLDRCPLYAPAGMQVLDAADDGSVAALLPRYEAFTAASLDLARHGVNFREIAGNRSAIMVSALVPREWSSGAQPCSILFSQPILTDSALKRVALTMRVGDFAEVLRSLSAGEGRVEHVFDY